MAYAPLIKNLHAEMESRDETDGAQVDSEPLMAPCGPDRPGEDSPPDEPVSPSPNDPVSPSLDDPVSPSLDDSVSPSPNDHESESNHDCEGPPPCLDPKAKGPHPWRLWMPEFGSIFLSAASMAAAISVVAAMDGQPVAQWKFPTSINTVVSTLAVVSKVSLAVAINASLGQDKWNLFRRRPERLAVFDKFDNAIRGPWGAMILLLWTGARLWIALGAVATIAGLAIGPFLQATIVFEGRLTEMADATSSISFAQKVDLGKMIPQKGGGLPVSPEGVQLDLWGLMPDFGLSSAIYDGFALSTTSPNVNLKTLDPAFTCSTGNCTWPVFTSAAVCSRCNDVTSHIMVSTVDKCVNENATDQTMPIIPLRKIEVEGRCTTFSVPWSRIRQFSESFADGPGEGIAAVFLTANVTEDYSDTITFKDSETMFFATLIFRAGENFFSGRVKWEDSMPSAVECGLYFCANAYDSSSGSGTLSERQVGSWATRDPKSWRAAYLGRSDEPLLQMMDRKHPTLANINLFRSDLRVSIPTAEAPSSLRDFNFTQATILGLQSLLMTLFQGGTVSSGGGTAYNGLVVYPQVEMGMAEWSPLVDVLWNSTDYSATFETLARRMTVQIRGASNSSQPGTASSYQIFVRIDWVYAILPAAVLAAGCIYFAIVFVQTSRRRLPVWKENAFPVMMHGLDDEARACLRSAGLDGASMAGASPGDELLVHLGGSRDELRMCGRKNTLT